MAESKYGPGWVRADCPDRKGGDTGGSDCVHLALVTDAIREEFLRERGAPLLNDTTHVARDEHDNWLQLTANEAWAWVLGAKAGAFDHLFGVPSSGAKGDTVLCAQGHAHGMALDALECNWDRANATADTGTPVEGWPQEHMLEAAFGLLCSAQPHGVLDGPHAARWSRAFERWRDAYNDVVSKECGPREGSCSA